MSATARDAASANPLGRAMARVAAWAGHTLLESGKFRTREGFVYVVRRRSCVVLAGGGGGFAREEAEYNIPCSRRTMKPPSEPGHDSCWQRLRVRYT